MFRRALLLLSFCALPLATFAASSDAPSIKADPADFSGQRAAVENEIEKGERFSELSEADREEVTRAFSRMEKLLAGKQSMADLDQASRVQLINDQELVNALLTKANADSRMVCKREKRVGSHRVTSTCRTAAAWKRASEQSREDIERRRSMGDILRGD